MKKRKQEKNIEGTITIPLELYNQLMADQAVVKVLRGLTQGEHASVYFLDTVRNILGTDGGGGNA